MISEVPVHVVKIGGSLLELPNLLKRIEVWLMAERAKFPTAHFVMIVGGGKLVDALRILDQRRDLGQSYCHWLAIDLMAVNTRIVHHLWPEVRLVETWVELNERIKRPGLTIFMATQFLRDVEPTMAGHRLVADWSVTSDSIAGRLAILLGAECLVLLKGGTSFRTEQRQQRAFKAVQRHVDAFFEVLWADLPSTELVSLPEMSLFASLGSASGNANRTSADLNRVRKM